MRALWIVWGAALIAGCGEPQYDEESHWHEGEMGEWRAGLTVGEAGGCSTGIVRPLSEQLIEEINCLRPGTLADFDHPNIQPNAVVFTSLQTAARDALLRAVANRGGMRMTSALRTLPQGYLLYRWWREGRCGIALAARPGRSRHESGLAIDISDNGAWRQTLSPHAWDWFGANDPPHFDYEGPGTVNLAGLSIRAFQRLWNRNHPEDVIDEDGLYGPQTEARLRRSPADGFPIGACQPGPPPEPDPVEPDPVEPEPMPEPMPEPVPEAMPQPEPMPEPRPEPEPSTPEPSTPEPSTPEPSTPEPSTPEPSTPEPSTPEPSTPEPSTPEPSTSEPSTPEPSTPEPSTPEPESQPNDPTVPPREAQPGDREQLPAPDAPVRLRGGCQIW